MDIAKSLFKHRDHEGYVGKEAHNVSLNNHIMSENNFHECTKKMYFISYNVHKMTIMYALCLEERTGNNHV